MHIATGYSLALIVNPFTQAILFYVVFIEDVECFIPHLPRALF